MRTMHILFSFPLVETVVYRFTYKNQLPTQFQIFSLIMDSVRSNPLICGQCQKEFTSVSNKNKHLRKMHYLDFAKTDRMHNIMCSLCTDEPREKFSCYNNLNKHFTNIHNIQITESVLNFRSCEEFEAWRGKENRDVDYACARALETRKGDRIVYYYCNRSNYRGYESNCVKRNKKFGGSIHIQGICPSRFSLKISRDGIYTVTFVETHVGHKDVPIRAQPNAKNNRHKITVKAHKESEKTNGSPHLDESEMLYLTEPTGRKLGNQDDVGHFVQKSRQHSISTNFVERREIALKDCNSFLRSLDEDAFNKFMAEMWKLRGSMGLGIDEHISKKRKVEKQMYLSK